jgi:hypothetical protein
LQGLALQLLSNLLRRLFSPNFRPDFREKPPIQAKSGPVPPNHFPTGPHSPSNYPEEFIEEAEDRPWAVPLQHSELLPEREILHDEMPTATKHASKRSEPGKKQIEHGPELYQNRGRTPQ